MKKGKIPINRAELQKDVINALLCEIMNRPEVTQAIDKMVKRIS